MVIQESLLLTFFYRKNSLDIPDHCANDTDWYERKKLIIGNFVALFCIIIILILAVASDYVVSTKISGPLALQIKS